LYLSGSQGYMYNKEKIDIVRNAMIHLKETVSVAESVTSGHLQAAFSSAEEASRFFQGGITAYNLGQKTRHLNVEPIYALSCNGVGQRVADEMAINSNTLFNSHWAIGITGYAAPVPELKIHELFAFFSVAYKKQLVVTGKVKAHQTNPVEVQVFFTNEVIKAFANFLTEDRILLA
jgi:nicotinamide-nucleotide amidase